MTFPSSIRPAVGQALINKVSRLFNGTISDVLHELFQNARRAGASAIHVALRKSPDGAILSILDDGCGIDDPATLLTLGDSDWHDGIVSREDPAGMGVFSLAGHDVRVRSSSTLSQQGWEVHIPVDGWQGAKPLAIGPAAISAGTEIEILLPPAWETQLPMALHKAAQYFPLPVYFGDVELARADFLAEAAYVDTWEGCRIGVYHGGTNDDLAAPRINFHGVTVGCPLPFVSETGRLLNWRVRVDIVDAPALQLVLPARKEMVENDALTRLRVAVEAAIFRAIARAPSHRLAYKAWLRAAELGVILPEADQILNAWVPSTADNAGVTVGAAIRSGPRMLMPDQEPDIEQALACALRTVWPVGGRPVRAEPAFEGYSWYDALPRVVGCAFRFQRGDASYCYKADSELPPELESGAVDSLVAELAILPNGDVAPSAEVYELPADMLACNSMTYSVEEAIILFGRHADVQPGALASLIFASLFCAADDGDCDSWETQAHEFEQQARHLANQLLLGEDEALLARLREAVHENVQWLIPKGRGLSLTVRENELTLALH
ncbi:ATP-binding protein [Sphingobium rhizovicinum]|uniref:ATP-binding protein n=1 Tax=Sphingobium rhizovicinum TaxID=432308 RepID=A0ABV7NLC9_9SPHN